MLSPMQHAQLNAGAGRTLSRLADELDELSTKWTDIAAGLRALRLDIAAGAFDDVLPAAIQLRADLLGQVTLDVDELSETSPFRRTDEALDWVINAFD